MKTNKHNNKNGFSVVEVMVASGLMAIVSVGILTMLANANKSQRSLQAKDLQREIMAEMVSHLSNKLACLGTLSNSVTIPPRIIRRGFPPRVIGTIPGSTTMTGLNPTEGPLIILNIKNPDGTAKYTQGSNHPAGLLQYRNFNLTGWAPDSIGSLQGTANLAVTLAKLGDVAGPKDLAPINIGLKIKLNASNQIEDCFSMGSNANGFWLADPANSSNIYYSGDIDVQGGIKIGGVGADADAVCTVAGQQRYNATSSLMQVCNGTSWAPLGIPGGGKKIYTNQATGQLVALTDAEVAAYTSTISVGGYNSCGSYNACYSYSSSGYYTSWGPSCTRGGWTSRCGGRPYYCSSTCTRSYGTPHGSLVPAN